MAKVLHIVLGALMMLVPLAAFTGPDIVGSVQHIQRVMQLRAATAKYRDVTVAIADGYLPTDECLTQSQGTTLYLHPQLASDLSSNPVQPEALLYAADASAPRLVAAVYRQPNHGQPRPSLFGQPFDGPTRTRLDAAGTHYTLYAWLWETNPAGAFAPWNPTLSC